jgi:uncharacterized membrane protein
MFHPLRRALAIGLASAVALGATAAPGALAQTIDGTPDARGGAVSMHGMNDRRSPDTRDAAQGRQIVATDPPTWPVNPQPITGSRAVASAPSSGLDWSSAGIGAAAVLGAFGIAAAGIVALRRRRIPRPGSLTTR